MGILEPTRRRGLIAAAVLALVLGSLGYAAWRIAHRPLGHRDAAERALPGEGERVRVEVLNASDVTGLSRAATGRLRDGGLDVVFFGTDTVGTLDSTQVLVRQGDAAAGERVKRVLGVGAVRAAPDAGRLVDVSVRLGRDFAARIGNP